MGVLKKYNREMFLVYHKHNDSLDSEWHFHIEYPRCPETNFIQLRFLDSGANENERLCGDCGKLESAMFRQKE